MKNNKNSNMLWFFSDYNDTFDIIENDTNKVEKLFNLLDDISNLKNLDKIAFSFVSLNNCEFLRNILLKIKNIINNPSSNIKNKDKILLFSAVGDNGYMLFLVTRIAQLFILHILNQKLGKCINYFTILISPESLFTQMTVRHIT